MHSADLERLYDYHAQALFGYLLNFTRHEADTHDLLQELFRKLAESPEMLNDVRDERAFLIRLAHNLAVDVIRRRATRQKTADQLAAESPAVFAPPNDTDEKVFCGSLADALGELPPDQRAVVHLKLWEGMTFEAIAEALDISPNTAASRYRYAIDKLRDHLRPLYDEIK